MSFHSVEMHRQSNSAPRISGLMLQRKCACGQHTRGGQCDQCRKKRTKLQRSATRRSEPTAVPPLVHQVLRSAGRPLDANTRAVMEPHFNHDFSQVRIHTNDQAAASAQVINAQAYTIGRDIVFGAGRYAPQSTTGKNLLAHELTHVVQQQDHASFPASLQMGPHNDAFEREADRAAGTLSSSTAEPHSQLQHSPARVSRQLGPFSPSGPGERFRGSTLPYREATELIECIRIMGEDNRDYCRQQVLGEEPPRPTHHQLPGISTPQPIDVRPNPDGSANFDVNGINVVFQPDQQSQDQAMAGRAETNFNISVSSINGQTQNGRVTSFTGPGPVTVTVQTVYGPGTAAASQSGYGRGTTATDVQIGTTSLGFHEGHHGLDFVQFMTANPFPQFTGTEGMTANQFQQAMNDYAAARTQYQQAMDAFSEQRTDCVGTTIDQANQANGLSTTICQQTP